MTTPTVHSALTAPRGAQPYVRVTSRGQQWVEFEFSLGDPALYVELVMRPEQFSAFCAAQCAITVSHQLGRALERERDKWSETVA
ncbi:phenol hydroxylase subunit [Cupriavidus consociatus]|uniref:phenol hydroxylase subunit n=1 Tax=Cupriavidus consociatus TaxID=2821357 RepID=UPI001AE79EDF|nr:MULTISPECIES: phenol hydroxylase subunit [unclassified Cupriavidus]MBP0625106.1 phenol hydroxylase [Cupriavidus sp. LEh25]MDK2661846.1 phenol hydroxylase subunit [Cupriavidus sp. LEh21]